MSRPSRQPSHDNGPNSTSQQKGRFSLSVPRFRRTPATREEPIPPIPRSSIPDGLMRDPPYSDKILNSSNNDLDIEPNKSTFSPDQSLASTLDPDYNQLRESIRKLRKAPPGSDPKSVDIAWEVYRRVREESLGYCRKLIQKSQNHGRNYSLESNIGPLDRHTRTSIGSGSNSDASSQFQINPQWSSAILDYKKIQEGMLNTLHTSLVLTYNSYEPEASQRQLEAFLADKELRRRLITKWRDASVHRLRSEKPEFFEKYKIRSSNYDRLKLDIEESERLFDVTESAHTPNRVIRETVISKNGDTILEFANRPSDNLPILRFRVSSHVLVDASLLFSHMLLPRSPEVGTPLNLLNDLPRAPSRITAKDGTEMKVYRMPQMEPNNHEALTILLHAAHGHEVPQRVEFPALVSIADVCLRYKCTSPVELQVRFQWLSYWEHKAEEDNPNELLLIAYVFGKRDLFTRISRSIIFNAKDDDDIQGKELWPQPIRDKIKGIRAAKMAQIYECCTNAVEEYLRPPLENTERPTHVGSLKLTTVPRCPRGSHTCDATNLGSLMQVFNELFMLPSFWKNAKPNPRRSLRELIDSLRLMPSPPQTHSGVCDYAPAFRNSINDIANSITGLTLYDVSGQHGWALSKNDPPQDRYADVSREVYELPARVRLETTESIALSDESINLRILSHLETLEDLQAAAMIDKTFYGTYKRNEVLLLRNIVKARLRQTPSAEVSQTSIPVSQSRPELVDPSDATAVELIEDSESILSDQSGPVSSISEDDHLYPSPPKLAIDSEAMPTSEEEARHFLALNVEATSRAYATRESLQPPPKHAQHSEQNQKFLVGDFAHLEDKARIGEDDMAKQLRDEKDRVLSSRGSNGGIFS